MTSRRLLAIAIATATLQFGGCAAEPPPPSSDPKESRSVGSSTGDSAAAMARTQSAQPVRRYGICDGSAAITLDPGYLVVANDENNVLSIYQTDTGSVPVERVQLSAALGLRGRRNREADIEAAAMMGDTAYWITSHANSRDGAHLADRHRLFATIEQRSNPVPTVRQVGRVYDGLVNALRADTTLARYGIAEASRRPPESVGGLNIEGLAATHDGRLLIGFRNPVPDGRALVVPIENPAGVIFREQEPRFGRAMTVALGGRGIRSIEYVPALRAYVIVAGSPNGGRDFALYRWSGTAADAPRQLQDVPLQGLSPEAIVVEDARSNRLLLLSDDGGRRTAGRECRDSDDSRKFFRTIAVHLTER